MEPQLLFAKAAPVATRRASRDHAAGCMPLPSRAVHVEGGVLLAVGPNEPGCPSGTMGKSVGNFIEHGLGMSSARWHDEGAAVHENEPSCINDGGIELHLRGGCGAMRQHEEEEEEKAQLVQIDPPSVQIDLPSVQIDHPPVQIDHPSVQIDHPSV